MKLILTNSLLLSAAVVNVQGFSSQEPRRAFLSKVQTIVAPALIATISSTSNPSIANAAAAKDLVNDLVESKEKMAPIPDLLQAEKWDQVRTILKTPPVNNLWNLGDSKNPLVQLAKESGEFELLELKDELSISLQMCDELTYNNAFVYFQPGNGKINIKQPTELAKKAMSQIGDAISLANAN